jgi:hypothetical protein
VPVVHLTMDRRVRHLEIAHQLFAEHGPAGRRKAYERAQACQARGEEDEAAMWLEVVRLIAGLTSLPGRDLTSETVLPFTTIRRRSFEIVPVEEPASNAAIRGSSDRGISTALGLLTLFGALVGAATLAATGLTAPTTGVNASQSAVTSSSAVDGHEALGIAAVAEPPRDYSPSVDPIAPVVTEAVTRDTPEPDVSRKPPKRSSMHKPSRTHKPSRKLLVNTHRHRREASFWERIATVFQ